jgi:hypothetical protein
LNIKKMSRIAPLVLLFMTSGISGGQVSQSSELTRLLEATRRCSSSQSGETVCETILPASLGTERNKAGDRVSIRTYLATGLAEDPITMLDATIEEVQPRVKGRSVLRIRIDNAVRNDGHGIPVEARIIAVISQSRVIERWDFPVIIVDRFPRMPEDDERLPGERKLSEDQPHASPLDSLPDLPVLRRIVCGKKTKKATADPCISLLEARGTYGYKTVTLEAGTSATESVLSSKKDMSFPAGTVLVLEIKNIPRSF